MTDPQIPYTPPAEPAPAATEPAPAVAPEAPTDFATHPVWGKALETVPDILRQPGTPLYEAIKTSENEARKAIESARGTDIPQDWRELVAEAQQMGLTVDELAQAYQGQQSLAEMMNNDPDGFVRELQAQVNALVESGQLTRAQGREAMQQVTDAAAAEQTDDLLTEEQKQLKELQAWKAEQEARAQREEQARQQQELAARIEREEEAASTAYFEAFDREMEAAGFMARNAASGQLESTIPVQTLQLIARTGAGLMDADPRLPREQAIKQATQQVRSMIEGAGGKLGPAAAAAAQVPVVGASSSFPTGQPQQPTGQPRTMADRMQAALAEATRQQGLSQ